MPGHYQCEHANARTILLYKPELTVFINSLHPLGALYEIPLNPSDAEKYSYFLIDYLASKNITVIELFYLLARTNNEAELNELRDFAFGCLKYEGPKQYASDEYKRKVINMLPAENLAHIILTNPTVHLVASHDNTGVITQSTSFYAVGNVVFCRDQQITTDKGVVVASFSAEQRKQENEILNFCLKKAGFNPIGDIRNAHEASLEGGDFVAINQDISAIGCGLRSSYSAGKYLMDQKLVGTKKFLIVKDVFDTNQDRMHLDCICAPLHDKLIVVDDTVLSQQRCHRYVDEYCLNENGTYDLNLQRTDVEFGYYLKESDYTVIRLPHERQLAYGCNALHLGLVDGKFTILTVDEQSKEIIEGSQEFKQYCRDNNVYIYLVYIPFRSITSMYGSLHCCTQVLERNDIYPLNYKYKYFAEKSFDCAIMVPSFCNSSAAVEESFKLYQRLLKEGKQVYLISKYKVQSRFSLRNSQAHSVTEIIDEVLSGKLKCDVVNEDGKDGLYYIGFEERDILHWF